MNSKLPPYPRFGECIGALASALDIKKIGSDVGRLAREGDFDWEKLDGVIQALLLDGTRWIVGAAADQLIAGWLSETRDSYCRLVLDVPLDSVGRDEVLPLLIEDFFAPHAARLLLKARELMPGPDLPRLLDATQAPVAVVLEWLDGRVNGSTEKLLYTESTGTDRVDRDKVSKWRNGVDLPSAQGIKLFSQRISATRHDAAEATTVGLWLMIAAALTRFDRAWVEPVRPLILRRLQARSLNPAVGSRLVELVRRVGQSWPELAEPGRQLWHNLMRTSTKQTGYQQRLWCEIDLLETRASICDPEGRTSYHYEWMKARWHVLSGQYQEALPHYERAFELACYRAGHQIKDILKEASCVAAFLEKKVFLKQLKHVGVALGLFHKPQSATVVEEWELEQFGQQLPLLFPPQGRFAECQQELSDSPRPGLMTISRETIARVNIDLKKLDRVRAVQFSNGVVRRWPQLRLFASFGMHAQVKALLDAGASVDELDSSGGSALLCALQYAEGTGERDVLDLLLKVPHQASALNTSTHRKRLTPLFCAIDLGAPDVVQALLEQGADADRRGLTDGQSPLYYVVSKLSGRVHAQRMYERLATGILSAPDLVQQDTLRRFGVGISGTFGDDTDLVQSHAVLALSAVKALVDQHVRRYSIGKLTQIVALLLKFGAKPNAAHGYPVPGRTPLMLAAESELPEVFDLMIEHGGEPLRPDAANQNCMHIAAAFRSRKIMDYLQDRAH